MPRKVKGKRSYRQVVRAVYETPWAIRPEKLQAIQSFLARRSAGEVLTRDEVRAAMAARGEPVRLQEEAAAQPQVALINVMGTIAQRLSLMEEISGGVSTERVGQALDEALADGNVQTIVLNVDSPGGSIFGVQELAAKIFAARKTKRIIAIANSEAASAALWIATAAGEFICQPGGWVGSIGVLMMHYSTAGWEAKEGYHTTITRRPLAKAEGAAGETLSDEALAYRQQLVDKTYEQFVADVAKHRGKTASQVERDFGGGRMLLAADALAAGLIDRTATLEDVLAELGVTRTSTEAAGRDGRRGETDTLPAAGSSPPPSPAGSADRAPALFLRGVTMKPEIFGALFRIGMIAITASQVEAQAALGNFLASQGVPKGATEEEQLATLEAYLAKHPRGANGNGGRAEEEDDDEEEPKPRKGKRRTRAQDNEEDDRDGDRAADITAAVRLAAGIPPARQVELIGELLSARDASGNPLSVPAAIRRIQEAAADTQTPAGHAPIVPGAAERDKFATAARDALLTRQFAGRQPEQIYDRFADQHVDWQPARGNRRLSSLVGLAEECLVMGGLDARKVRDLPKLSIARLILGANPREFGLSAASDGPAYNVSGMFSNILLDASHVVLRRSYDDARTTFQVWMGQSPALEYFRPTHSAIAGELGDPRAIPEDGEFEESTFADAKESFKVTTWGQLFSLSYEAIVNDRRNMAFLEVPQKMGGAMRRKQNRLAYGVLKDNAAMADNVALFNGTAQASGGHNNLTTGADTPKVATLNTMTKKMMEQRGLNVTEGAALNIMPRFLIGPPALRGTILEFLASISNPAGTHSGVANIWHNDLEPVIEAELGAAATGGSDTAFYTACDYGENPTVTYAYLEGLETPVVETQVAFDHLAMKWRIYHAFAVHPLDYRGLQKHAGA